MKKLKDWMNRAVEKDRIYTNWDRVDAIITGMIWGVIMVAFLLFLDMLI